MTRVRQVSTAIIGGGLAGLAAAARLHHRGITDIVILEREKKPGGILRRYIHDGFGLTRFKETLSGPEYAQCLMDMADDMGTPYIADTIVLEITPDKRIYASSREGIIELQAKAVILTMGYRERIRDTVGIPGKRPAGIYAVDVAQVYINLQNKMVGGEAVILGSGDIDMIVARRLALEGTHVRAAFGIQPYSDGLPRSIEQCLRDYDISLYLSHIVTDILGRERLEGMTVFRVGGHIQPIPGGEKAYACDILILSVGPIPEDKLSLGAGVILGGKSKGAVVDENHQTSVDGILAADDVLRVHDLVDFVSREAERLGDATAEYVRKGGLPSYGLGIRTGEHITHTIPQKISRNRSFCLSLRVKRSINDYRVRMLQGGRVIKEQTFKKTNPAETIQITVDASVLGCRGNVEVKVV